MPHRFKDVEVRSLLIRLFLEMARGQSVAYLGESLYGIHVDEVILCCCVALGQLEGRPMNASELSAYAGMPRTTVLRKMAVLKKRGFIAEEKHGKFSVLNPDKANRKELIALMAAHVKLIHKASRELSKLDTKTFA